MRVRLPPASSTSTEVQISGPVDGIEGALVAMQEKLGFEPSDVPLRRVRLAVQRRDHSKLIGRGGSVVRGLEARFQCNVHIPRRQDRNSDVEVEGPPERVADVIGEISRILGSEVRVAGGGDEAKEEEEAAKPDYSKPINETLFFPDRDGSDGWNHSRFLGYLRSATESLDIAIFTMSDDRIKDIILKLHRKGVRVRIVTDNSCMDNKGSDIHALAAAGVPCKMDISDHHFHLKHSIIDGRLLLHGSFNYTYSAATKNAEVIVITNSKPQVEDFKAHFETMWSNEEEFAVVKE